MPPQETKRILLVSLADLYGGAETYYVKLAEILRAHYSVSAIVLEPTLAGELEKRGIPTRLLQTSGSRYAAAIPALFSTLREFRPDLIHLNGQAEAYLALPLIFSRVPIAITRHTPLADLYLSAGSRVPVPLKRFLVVSSHRRAKHVICVSKHLKSQLQQYVPAQKLSVIHTWLATDSVAPPRPIGTQSVPFKLLYAGRVVKAKGIFDLIEAIRDLSEVSLDVIGDGADLERASIAATNLSVTFHGFQQNCLPYYRNADLLVFPSHEGFEGLPQVPLEAMGAGLPCLASDIEAMKELVSDDHPAAFFQTGNVNDLKRQLLRLQQQPIRLQELSQAGVKRVASAFLVASVNSRYTELFDQLIAQTRKST